MSGSQLVHTVTLCPFEWANNCALCVCFVAGEPGALPVPLAEPQCQTQRGGWHGAAQQDQWGLHRGQSQEEIHGWLHLCILWLTIAARSPARNSWAPSRPCSSQNSWMVIHSVTVAVSNSWCWEVTPSYGGSPVCRGQKASLCSPPPRPLTPAPSPNHRFTLVLSHCGAKLCEKWGDCVMKTFTVKKKKKKIRTLLISFFLFFFYCGWDLKWQAENYHFHTVHHTNERF